MENLLDSLLHKLNELHETITSNEWKKYSRKSFVHALNNTITRLEEIVEVIEELQKRIEKEPAVDAPDLSPLISAYNKTLISLRRNVALEEAKKEMPFDLKDRTEVPELYAFMGEKIMSLLLKTRFAIERVHLHAVKERITPEQEKATAKNILSLLQSREKELQELKEKYEKLREKNLGVTVSDKTIAGTEKEANELASKITTETALIESNFDQLRKKIEGINSEFNVLRLKSKVLENLANEFAEKSNELTSMLKIERDNAKQMLMEIESESLSLRGQYSKELLNLNESKIQAKKEIEQELREKMMLEKESLKEKSKLLEQFEKIVEDRNKKIAELERDLGYKKAKKILESVLEPKGHKKKAKKKKKK
ncbi:hypothetical protein KKG83_06225 [Candidatus Micrarchaeota archaeon]|nr:hypothetical protein [Candidatus Micrarchaeota archaeon]